MHIPIDGCWDTINKQWDNFEVFAWRSGLHLITNRRIDRNISILIIIEEIDRVSLFW